MPVNILLLTPACPHVTIKAQSNRNANFANLIMATRGGSVVANGRSLLARMSSIRFRLIVVPLLLLSLAIGVLGIVTFGFVRTAMLKGMQGLGLDLAAQAVNRLVDNAAALNEVESALAHILLGIGRMAAANRDSISNDYLERLAETLSADVIYWYNRNLEIVASATGEHLGPIDAGDYCIGG
jgi:hypothetical protein